MVNKVDEYFPNITLAPSFYASLEKLSEEDKAGIMKTIADMSEMTMKEIAAISECVTCDKPALQCECNGSNC